MNSSRKKLLIRRIVIDFLLTGLLVGMLTQGDLVEYGLTMARGQITILVKAKPIKKYLADPNVPDSLKQKVLLIQDIKTFCYDSLGMNHTRNYEKIYDQKGKPLLWVVTACKPYALAPKIWKFPVIGAVTYKGFFSQEAAKEEETSLIKEGYETKIRIVNAWSTLGWFRDPIMSSMLEDSEGDIANVIIHELSHGTIFIKNDVEYSENLANFIGDQGSYLYLKTKYGEDSELYRSFYQSNEDYVNFAGHFVQGAKRLDSLYTAMESARLPLSERAVKKEILIRDIVNGLDEIAFYYPDRYKKVFRETLPNNAFFIVYLQYNNQQDEFRKEFEEVAGGNLRRYIEYLREKFEG